MLLACVIGPLFRYLKLLPMYKAHEGIAYGIVSVYGFLFAVAIYYYRPSFLRSRAVSTVLPAALVLASVCSVILYLTTMNRSIRMETEFATSVGVESSQLTADQILTRTAFENVPLSTRLILFYLLAFFGAETALILFALKEYAQPWRKT